MNNPNEFKEFDADQCADWVKAYGAEFANDEGRAYLSLRIAIALQDICTELQTISKHLEGIRAGVGGLDLPWTECTTTAERD